MNGLIDRYDGLLILLAGAAAVSAFAPVGWFPVAILSLAILFNQWTRDTPQQAFRHGLLFGVGYFGAGISWVYVSVHTFGHVPLLAALPVTLALVVFLAIYPALLGYCLRRFFREINWGVLVLAAPAGWVLAEWLRGWLLSGFPWLAIGYSQIDSPLGGYSPLLGVLGVGWLVALSATLLLAMLMNRQRAASLICLLMLWAGGVLLDRIEWTSPRGTALQVKLVQGNISQEDKWAPENFLSTLKRYSDLSFTDDSSDLIVWPETAIPKFYDQVAGNFIPYLETQLEETGAALLTGIPVLDKQDWEYFNAVVALGGEQGFYYKQHLVPFGEYLPLRWLLGNTLDALAVPNADFSSGSATQTLLKAAGYPIAASICFEIVFGEQIIKSLPEAALLVNVSNDAWFGHSLAPHQHLEMARMRAKETGRPLLRATNTGISAIIDHHGRIQQRSPQFEIAVVEDAVVPMQGATPYVLAGTTPILVIAFVSLLVVRIRRASSKAVGSESC